MKDKKQSDQNQGLDLEKKLQEAGQRQDTKNWENEIEKLNKKIDELEKQKKEIEEIAKRSQYDYINLKLDFDRFQKQTQENSKNLGIDLLINTVKKFLPFIEDLRKSLENITQEHMQDPLTKWVQIIYNKFLKTLEVMWIHSIKAVGLVPDSFLHEPVSVQEVENDKMKGKIIQEFERGFIYEKGGEKKVIISSKVIVGK